jgi:hypothetical protein
MRQGKLCQGAGGFRSVTAILKDVQCAISDLDHTVRVRAACETAAADKRTGCAADVIKAPVINIIGDPVVDAPYVVGGGGVPLRGEKLQRVAYALGRPARRNRRLEPLPQRLRGIDLQADKLRRGRDKIKWVYFI